MNSIVLTGRMTKDIDVKSTPTGKTVGTFSIAVDDGYGDNKKTYFHNVVVWGKTAETMAQYTHKGSKIAVNGKLTSRSYEKDGQKRYITEIVADMYGGIEFLESKNSNDYTSNNNFAGQNLPDEEIPF